MKSNFFIFSLAISLFLYSCGPKVVKRDDAIINYKITGKGDTTLLFVHGSYIDQSYWDAQVPFFSPKYKVVTFDLPGHGKSGKDRKNWSIKGFAEDVVSLVKELELKNVILIGHSMGGDINLIAATNYPAPIVGFVGIDNFKNAATPIPEQYKPQIDTILMKLKNDFANTIEQSVRASLVTKETPKSIKERVVHDFRNANQNMSEHLMPEFFELGNTERDLLPKLKLKMYLIISDYIPVTEAPLKQYATSGYEVLTMKGTCHYPMLENPDEFNKQLQNAINKIGKK